eukprot:2152-Heterococcus_DN1.PRE.2
MALQGKRLRAVCNDACALSYLAKDEKEAGLVHLKGWKFHAEEPTENDGYVLVNRGLKAVLAVARGTERSSFKEWANNFNIARVALATPASYQGPELMVNKAVTQTKGHDFLFNTVKDLLAERSFDQVIVTGHSRGGGIAQLVTWR